ncbi:MAG: nucleotidyltransferase family protein [Chloroflexaceae bacterium]|nr:nucleotidyltransferase family protein [Chloroflexaceae bacterium]
MTIAQIRDTWPVAAHLATLRAHLPTLAQRYHIKTLGLFGSYIRNEQTPDSDLDVLVRFRPDATPTLLSVAALELELRDLLGMPVDLVLDDGLRGEIGQRIRDEVVWL